MMNTRIQHWHRAYRLREPHVLGWEHLAQGAVMLAFEQALAQVVINEREVVLIRQVSLRFTAQEPQDSPSELAIQWGRAMATAVREALERNDPNNVRRFVDEQEQLVCFIAALLKRDQADAWFFSRLRASPKQPTLEMQTELEALLSRHIEHWPELLARLSQRGLVRELLNNLSEAMRDLLWSKGICGDWNRSAHASERPIFAAAIQIVSLLFDRSLTVLESNEAFETFVSRPQPETDWSDTTHLAEAVFAAVRFLVERFAIEVQKTSANAQELTTHVPSIIERFDWLDGEWLQRRLNALMNRARLPKGTSTTSDTGSRIAFETVWLTAWHLLESRFYAEWDASMPNSVANRLLAMSLLIEQNAAWVHDPALARFVEHVLSSPRHAIKQPPIKLLGEQATTHGPIFDHANSTSPQLIAIQQPLGASANQTVGDKQRPSELGSYQPTTQDESVEKLLGSSPSAHIHTSKTNSQVATNFAGVFLLARGLHDLRLTSLAKQAKVPSANALAPAQLLAELACNWAECELPVEPDLGLLEFCRMGSAANWSDLSIPFQATDEACVQSFQSRLAHTLIGLGSWTTPHRLYLFLHRTESGSEWLLGGDLDGQVYPWCVPLDNFNQAAANIEQWQSALASWSNEKVELIIDESARACAGNLGPAAVAWGSLANKPIGPEKAASSANAAWNAVVSSASACVLRHWARSLRGLGSSSNTFLLRQLIQRSGTIQIHKRQVQIGLESRPLDAALEAFGMFEPLDYFNGKELINIRYHKLA